MIWSILGVSVAVVALFCIAVAELVCGQEYFEEHRLLISLALGLVGMGVWSFGRWKPAQRARTEEVPVADEEAKVAKFDFLQSSGYWGPMIIVFSLVAFFIQPLRQKMTPKIIASSPAPVPRPAVKLPPVASIEFPKMKLQGVNTLGGDPNVIINGRVYTIGDHLGPAVIKAIDRQGVTLELSGQIKVLRLQ